MFGPGSRPNRRRIQTYGTGAVFLRNATPILDANYAALSSDSRIAYSTLTAARTGTIPLARSCAPRQRIILADESGSCSSTNTLTYNRAGADTIQGQTALILASAYAFIELETDGISKWWITDFLYTPFNFGSGWEVSPRASCAAMNTWWLAGVQTAGAVAITSASEVVGAAVLIPGGSIGNNGHVKTTFYGQCTNSSNAKVYTVRFGSNNNTSGTVFYQQSITTYTCGKIQCEIANENSASSQVGPATNIQGFGVSTGANITASVNTANASYIVLSGSAAGSETMYYDSYTVEVLYGA